MYAVATLAHGKAYIMTSARKTIIAAIAMASLVPAMASAEDNGENLRTSFEELREAKAAAQQPSDGSTSYTFGQNLPSLDLPAARSPVYGFGTTLTPNYGTSSSFPGETYVPIPENQSSFGFSIRF